MGKRSDGDEFCFYDRRRRSIPASAVACAAESIAQPGSESERRRRVVDEQLSQLGAFGDLPLHASLERSSECEPAGSLEDPTNDELVFAEGFILVDGVIDWQPEGSTA